MAANSIKFILETLRAFVVDELPLAPELNPEELQEADDFIKGNKLEPIFGKYLIDTVCEDSPLKQLIVAYEQAYRRCLVRGYNHLQTGTTLWQQLEEAGIPCIAYKGPFHGEMLYHDTGMRYFADIDLLVHPDHAENARLQACEQGWALRNPHVPLSFYRRHHLHWPLHKEPAGALCDLHWFVDHPYKLYCIDYCEIFDRSRIIQNNGFTWRSPSAEDLLLLACVNLIKECRNQVCTIFEQTADRQILQSGILRYWLDIALILQQYDQELDWDYILQHAHDWNIVYALNAGLYGAIKLFHTYIPQEVQDQMIHAGSTQPPPSFIQGAIKKSGAAAAIGHMGGFKPESLEDAFYYLFPPVHYFKQKTGLALTYHRASHFLHASLRLSSAIADVAICKVIYQIRRLQSRTYKHRAISEAIN